MPTSSSGPPGKVSVSQLGRRAADLPRTLSVDRTLSPDIFDVTYPSWPCCQELLLDGRRCASDLLTLTWSSNNGGCGPYSTLMLLYYRLVQAFKGEDGVESLW